MNLIDITNIIIYVVTIISGLNRAHPINQHIILPFTYINSIMQEKIVFVNLLYYCNFYNGRGNFWMGSILSKNEIVQQYKV